MHKNYISNKTGDLNLDQRAKLTYNREMTLPGSWVKFPNLFAAIFFTNKDRLYYPEQDSSDGFYGRHPAKLAIKRGNEP